MIPQLEVTAGCVCEAFADSDGCGCRPCSDRARQSASCPHRLNGVLTGSVDSGLLYDGMCDRCFEEARDIRLCGLRLAEHELSVSTPSGPPTVSTPNRAQRGGLDGTPCPERADLDQGYDLVPPRQRMCRRCGRVTARVDVEGSAWCGGPTTREAP